MDVLEEKVYNDIVEQKLITDGDKVVLGVSGGPDSLSMLNILNNIRKEKKIQFEIYVAHINHMIRNEANDEEEFVKNFSKRLDIPFFSKRVDIKNIAKEVKQGTEEAGRKARYDFFEEILSYTKSNKNAIAHNRNDKIETIIMNLLRGTGISGLEGIKPIVNNKYIRPILKIDRQEIEEYCQKMQLDPRIDKTNFENIYTRNKIRNIIIPYIKKEFNPNIIDTIDRLSYLVSEEEKYLNKIVLEKYEKVLVQEKNNEIVFNLRKLNEEDDIIYKKIVLHAINNINGNHLGIEKKHLDDIVKLGKKNVGNKFLTPKKNLKIYVNNGKMYISIVK